jgi:hypothetical protein
MSASSAEFTSADWNGLYKIGGTTALLSVLVSLGEIFVPGDSTPPKTVIDLFVLLQTSAPAGLRDLGLVNVIIIILGVPTFFALYAAHRQVNRAYAALAMVISYIGVAVFLGTNRALPMLALSGQYAAAATEAQRSMLSAAGQALFAEGGSHTPGTFIGFAFIQVAGIAISVVILASKVFNKVTALAGILGYSCMLVFEVCASFVPAMFGVAMIFAVAGGLLYVLWHLLIAWRLFELGRRR